MSSYDLVVIGAGPGGYPAAIKAATEGLKVALVEKDQLGGTCLNRGCIPSKALIASARRYHQVKEAEKFGIHVQGLALDYAQMVERAETVVKDIRNSLTQLLRAHGVTVIQGAASFISPKELQVGSEQITANKIILATGAEPLIIPAFKTDGTTIHDSTSILKLKKLPKSLLIIGGGVIGVEFASMYNLLGVDVTVVEMLPRLIATESSQVSSFLERSLKKRGVKFFLNTPVEKVEKIAGEVEIKLKEQILKSEMVLVAVGRKVNSSALNLKAAGLTTDEKGALSINDKMETKVPGIYAIGDLTGKWWLAHVATHQGIVAVKNVLGHKEIFDTSAIPAVIFTDPEIASVGLSLDEAKKRGYNVEVGQFPFQALGKSRAISETEGYAEMIIDAKTGQILGASVIGHEASTLIAELALAIRNELTVECIVETIHAHPTLSEAWQEAALLAMHTPLHMPPKKT